MKRLNNIKFKWVHGLALSGVLTVNAAFADCSKSELREDDNLCAYFVAGVNYSYLHPHSNGSSWRVTDEYGHGVEFAAGVHANENWSVEISYADLGSAGMQNQT